MYLSLNENRWNKVTQRPRNYASALLNRLYFGINLKENILSSQEDGQKPWLREPLKGCSLGFWWSHLQPGYVMRTKIPSTQSKAPFLSMCWIVTIVTVLLKPLLSYLMKPLLTKRNCSRPQSKACPPWANNSFSKVSIQGISECLCSEEIGRRGWMYEPKTWHSEDVVPLAKPRTGYPCFVQVLR